MRPVPLLHLAGTVLLAGSLVVQVFLAGLGVFDDPAMFVTHAGFGYLVWFIATLVIVLAVLTRAGRVQVGRAGLVWLLILAQSLLVGARGAWPAIAALHPLNGFLLLGIALLMTRTAWQAREIRVAVPYRAAAGDAGL